MLIACLLKLTFVFSTVTIIINNPQGPLKMCQLNGEVHENFDRCDKLILSYKSNDDTKMTQSFTTNSLLVSNCDTDVTIITISERGVVTGFSNYKFNSFRFYYEIGYNTSVEIKQNTGKSKYRLNLHAKDNKNIAIYTKENRWAAPNTNFIGCNIYFSEEAVIKIFKTQNRYLINLINANTKYVWECFLDKSKKAITQPTDRDNVFFKCEQDEDLYLVLYYDTN